MIQRRANGLFQEVKIQNLKAIHNGTAQATICAETVSGGKDTKSESNSQPMTAITLVIVDCFRR